jgi:energy-converting hydrogenase A subunit P
LIQYKSSNCIRNAYFHNSCSDCVSVCPESVFSIFQNKIKVEAEKCTGCSACVGACPTEALIVENVDPNLEIAGKIEDIVSCDMKVCLARFDSQHLIVSALKNEKFTIDLSKCGECEIGQFSETIEERVEKANIFLEQLEVSNRVSISKEKTENIEKNSKRELFKNIFKKGEEEKTKPIEKKRFTKNLYPLKQQILIDEVRKIENEFQLKNDLIRTQEISSSCTNCWDCVQFCPTEALFYSPDKLQIFIHSNLCISCGICNHICKVDAIKSSDEVSLLDLVKPKELIKFEMAVCPECKTPFIRRGDEEICDRCIDFVSNHSNIFTLARDI